MGNSIGCIASSHLATDEKLFFDFKCLILISPTLQSLKLLSSNYLKLANPVTQALIDLSGKICNNDLTQKSETKSIYAEGNCEAKDDFYNNINKNINNNKIIIKENKSNTNSNKNDNNYFGKRNNKYLINEFNLPIFILNGKEEDSLTYFQCVDFVKKFKVQNSWFPSNANYLNLIQNCRKKFYEKIKEFIKKLIVYESNDSFCGLSISEDKTNFNINLINNYNNNKMFMKFLRNRTRQESGLSKEDGKQTNIEKKYLQEMEQSKIIKYEFFSKIIVNR